MTITFYFDFIQRPLFQSSRGLTSTVLAPVGMHCLFLSLMSVPLQHESCKWTFPPLPCPSRSSPQETHTSGSLLPHPPAMTWRGGNALSLVSSIDVNSLLRHQHQSVFFFFFLRWHLCVCDYLLSNNCLSYSVCFHTHSLTHRVA